MGKLSLKNHLTVKIGRLNYLVFQWSRCFSCTSTIKDSVYSGFNSKVSKNYGNVVLDSLNIAFRNENDSLVQIFMKSKFVETENSRTKISQMLVNEQLKFLNIL